MLVAKDETMTFQRNGQAMRGRTCKPCGCNELAQCGRPTFQGLKNLDCLIKDADAGMNLVVNRGTT